MATKKTQKKATLEDLIKALNLNKKAAKGDTHAYGEVKSINEDGTYNVALNGSNTTVKCARLAGAKVGDTVFCTILKNGFAVVTNTVGGDTDARDALEAFKIIYSVAESPQSIQPGHTQLIEVSVVVPDGYRVIGLLSIFNDTIDRTGITISQWYVENNGNVTIEFYNAGTVAARVLPVVTLLCTSL